MQKKKKRTSETETMANNTEEMYHISGLIAKGW